MNKYLLCLTFLYSIISFGQTINIPDADFKNVLLNGYVGDPNQVAIDIDLNDDGEIQINEAELVYYLNLNYLNLSSTEGIQYFVNLKGLHCEGNNITSLNLSSITIMDYLYVEDNDNLLTIDISNVSSIGELWITENNNLVNIFSNNILTVNEILEISVNNNLVNLNFSNLEDVGNLSFSGNALLSNVDLTNLYSAETLGISYSPIESINLPNLYSVDRFIGINNNYSLTNVDLSNLFSTGGFVFHHNDLITSISANNLTTVDAFNPNPSSNDGSIYLAENANLTQVSFSNLTNVDQNFSSEPSNPNIIDINLLSLENVGNDLTFERNSSTVMDLSNLITVGGDINYDNATPSSLLLGNLITVTDINAANSNITQVDLINLQEVRDLEMSSNSLTTMNLSNLNTARHIKLSNNSLTSFTINLDTINNLDLGNNNLSSLNLNSLVDATQLYINSNNLTSINLSNLSTVSILNLSGNMLSILQLPNLTDIFKLYISDNQLTEINNTLPGIQALSINNNFLTNLDFLESPSLSHLYAENNPFVSLDLSNIDVAYNLDLDNIPTLESLFIKNGSEVDVLSLWGNDNLQYICVDEEEQFNVLEVLEDSQIENCEVNTYCSFVPGAEHYQITGNVKLDYFNNGCDIDDPVFPLLNFHITNGIMESNLISNESGIYSLSVNDGNHVITPIFENPEYFVVTPEYLEINLPLDENTLVHDFCITANGIINDLEIVVNPLTPAVPGFDSKYEIFVKNKGNTTLSGNITLNFDDDLMDVIFTSPNTESQATGALSWNYSDLFPMENRSFYVNMNLNTPTDTPALIGGDNLNFTATITPVTGDETDLDNEFGLKQTVTNSFDPNDKTCLEGNIISPEMVGEYVHYLIRFENTGTWHATNIVVKDYINLNQFDIESLIPLNGSHDFVTRITEANKVEFIFENINLPYEDDNNDGFVLFKIKTKPDLQLGETFENKAEIYFDFNFPIITNLEVTTIEETMGTNDIDFPADVRIFPNPTDGTFLNLESSFSFSTVNIYDLHGRLIQKVQSTELLFNADIDLTDLAGGVYFIEVVNGKYRHVQKFIKN